MNLLCITLYGIILESLSANFSCTRHRTDKCFVNYVSVMCFATCSATCTDPSKFLIHVFLVLSYRVLIHLYMCTFLYQWFYFEFQQPMTGIEGFKYQTIYGLVSVIRTLFVRDFAVMGSSSFNPHAQFLVHSAE